MGTGGDAVSLHVVRTSRSRFFEMEDGLSEMDARPLLRGRRDTLSSLGARRKAGRARDRGAIRPHRHDARRERLLRDLREGLTRGRALSVCAFGRTTSSRSGVPLSAGRRQRSERGDRSRRLSLAGILAGPPMGRHRALRAPCRRLFPRGNVRGSRAEAQPSCGARGHGRRDHAGQRFQRPLELGI